MHKGWKVSGTKKKEQNLAIIDLLGNITPSINGAFRKLETPGSNN